MFSLTYDIDLRTVLFTIIISAILLRGLLLLSTLVFSQSSLPSTTYRSPAPGIGVCCIQGRRSHMEDTFRVEMSVMGSSSNSFFAVYDGHGGDKASRFLEDDLHARIEDDVELLRENPVLAIKNAFAASERELLRSSTFDGWLDGSTAISCMVLNNKVYTANVGDSRAVICSAGTAIALSTDHKPSNDDEKERITKAGGKIIHLGVWRVEGVLALSRAFGDRHLKKYVTAEPDVLERTIEKDDLFLVLASDGIWDVLSNQEVVDIVSATNYRKDARSSSRKLVETAYRRGSQDNMTCIVVDLERYKGPTIENIITHPDK